MDSYDEYRNLRLFEKSRNEALLPTLTITGVKANRLKLKN